MDVEAARWFTDQDLNDYSLIHEYHMESVAELKSENLKQSLSSESYNSSYPNCNFNGSEKPAKIQKTNNSTIITAQDHQYNSPKISSSSSSSQILSFEVSPNFYMNIPKDEVAANNISPNNHFQPKPAHHQGSNNKRSHCSITRTPSHAHDHILAERKRREKLSQRFIALSALVPGLKKMDKATVLGDSIKYLKQLQERVHVLEEQTKKRSVECVVLVKKSHVSPDDSSSSSCDENSADGLSNSSLPEIEARVSEKDVLVRIHCDKQHRIIPKILNEIENLHLSIINTSVLPFGNSTLDITIIAKMDAEFSIAVKDVVKNLRLAFLNFM